MQNCKIISIIKRKNTISKLIDKRGSLSYNYLSPRYWSILLEYILYVIYVYPPVMCRYTVWCGKVVIHVYVCIFIFMCCTTRQILIIFGTTPVCVIYVYHGNCFISQCMMMQIEINWWIDWLMYTLSTQLRAVVPNVVTNSRYQTIEEWCILCVNNYHRKHFLKYIFK